MSHFCRRADASSQAANLCLFCQPPGIHLVSLHDDDLQSSLTTVLWWKWRSQWDVFFFYKQHHETQTHTHGHRLAKVNTVCELLPGGTFANSFPREVKSTSLDNVSYVSVVQLNTSQAFQSGPESPVRQQFYLFETLQIRLQPAENHLCETKTCFSP